MGTPSLITWQQKATGALHIASSAALTGAAAFLVGSPVSVILAATVVGINWFEQQREGARSFRLLDRIV